MFCRPMAVATARKNVAENVPRASLLAIEDHRRESNGQQFSRLVSAAAKHPVSRNWKGYWQRRVKVAAE